LYVVFVHVLTLHKIITTNRLFSIGNVNC
jgi:hypothetical protein